MEVKLLTSYTSISDMVSFATRAALICHGNENKDVKPKELLGRIIKLGHESVLEHIYLTFRIANISRALLQQLARHRHITLSVESTRHCLLKKLSNFDNILDYAIETAKDDSLLQEMLNIWNNLCRIANENPALPNDELKYFIPEFFPTSLFMSTNVRELRHILELRTSPAAMKEFRMLGISLFTSVPDEFKYLLEDCVYVA